MDYIREELRRQERLLSVLLQGGETKNTAKAEEEPASALSLAEGMSPLKSEGVSQMRSPFAAALPESGRTGLRQAETDGTLSRWSAGETVETQGVRLRREVLPEVETGTFRSGRDGSTAGIMVADVRGVSRAIQRDARRYDGGFSIY